MHIKFFVILLLNFITTNIYSMERLKDELEFYPRLISDEEIDQRTKTEDTYNYLVDFLNQQREDKFPEAIIENENFIPQSMAPKKSNTANQKKRQRKKRSKTLKNKQQPIETCTQTMSTKKQLVPANSKSTFKNRAQKLKDLEKTIDYIEKTINYVEQAKRLLQNLGSLVPEENNQSKTLSIIRCPENAENLTFKTQLFLTELTRHCRTMCKKENLDELKVSSHEGALFTFTLGKNQLAFSEILINVVNRIVSDPSLTIVQYREYLKKFTTESCVEIPDQAIDEK